MFDTLSTDGALEEGNMKTNTSDRTAELEQQVSRLMDQVAALEARVAEPRPGVSGGNKGRADGNGNPKSRRDVLKLAAAAAAGVGVATIVRPREAQAASTAVLTEATVNAQAPTQISGTTPFSVSTTSNAVFRADAAGVGNGSINGIEARGSVLGQGLAAYGGTASGQGIYAEGGVGGIGIDARGGSGSSTNAHGIRAIGSGVGGLFQGTRAAVNLQPGGSAAGPPATGFHDRGDIWFDGQQTLWVCLTAGTPGAFRPLQPGGQNQSIFTVASNSQYTLGSSDGTTWQDIDAANLMISFTPGYNCWIVITAGADLWTTKVGLNQDMGILMSGGAFGSGTVVAWKESGGFAAYAPNAAHVESVNQLSGGTAYTIKLQWKSNNAFGSPYFIVAAAGPSAPYSPTRLTARLVPTA